MRVVLSILDAMPPGVITPQATPNLWKQVEIGGRAPEGGRSLPMSVTYSNHAAFVTGVGPEVTGLWGNVGYYEGAFHNTYRSGPRATTLFDRCAEAGLRSVCVVGDHSLIQGMGASAASVSWPPTPQVPEGTAVDRYGYPADSAVIEAASELDLASADLVVMHLNEPDTTLHVFGPESIEFQEQIGLSDQAYGELVELLMPGWDDTVLITISDHQQEQITAAECVDLRTACETAGWDADVRHDGTGALVVSNRPGSVSVEDLRAIEGVEGALRMDENVLIAWTEPGKMFGSGPRPCEGAHGSPRCRPQVAIISGGHDAVPELARSIEKVQPTTLTWAPLIRDLLDI